MSLRSTRCGLLLAIALAAANSAFADQPASEQCVARAPTAARLESAPTSRSLRDVLTQVLRDDPSIAAGRLDVAASQDGIDAARARFLPVVQVSGQEGRTRRKDLLQDPSPAAKPLSSSQYEIALSQTVFDAMKTRYGVDEARGRALQEKNRLRKALNERLLAVLESFQNLRVERLRLAASEAALDELDKLVRITSARVGAGQASLVDLRRAQARLIEAKRTVEDSSASCRQVKERFERLTNIPAEDVSDPGPAFIPLAEPERRRLSTLCATQCTDLQDSLQQLERGRAELGMQKAADKPTVSLQASASSFRNGNGVVEHYRNYAVGLKLSWTLYSGGEYTARTSQVERNVAALEARVNDARQKAAEDFFASDLQYTSALTSYDLAVAGTAVAREARLLAERAYNAGLRGTIEFADTIADETRHINSTLSLDARRFVAMYAIYAMVGELPRLFDLPGE